MARASADHLEQGGSRLCRAAAQAPRTGAIETLPQGYRLSVPPDDVDMHRFERLLSRASELLALGEPDRARFVADEALASGRASRCSTSLTGTPGGWRAPG